MKRKSKEWASSGAEAEESYESDEESEDDDVDMSMPQTNGTDKGTSTDMAWV